MPARLSPEPFWKRRPSIRELRYRVERTPTTVNRLALAERLMETNSHREAIPKLEAILAIEDSYCQALHDLALCRLACQEPDQALPLLDRLIKKDHRWADYRAWRTLIEVHEARKPPPDALKASRELEKMSPRWENKCLLAEHLLDAGLKEEVIGLLDQALEDHSFAPLDTRLHDWKWARARGLLREAEGK